MNRLKRYNKTLCKAGERIFKQITIYSGFIRLNRTQTGTELRHSAFSIHSAVPAGPSAYDILNQECEYVRGLYV